MSHFAKVVDGIVTEVIVAEIEFFDTFIDSSPGDWIETSYDGDIRKNYAGEGYTYDPVRDAFYGPQPHNSWILNEDTCLWDSPIPYPTDGKKYNWNEDTLSWDEFVEPV
jgi:hypothetical protein